MTEKQTIRKVIDYYVKKAYGPCDAIDILQKELDYAHTENLKGNTVKAIRRLLDAWEVADEHELVKNLAKYPGPYVAFDKLVVKYDSQL